jgi:precorrin-2 dehydrogenase/sirohydrochlorin ferrochelatase
VSYYPVFLKLSQRPCLVIGGGEVAARKVDGLLRAGAQVTVIAPHVEARLRRWADDREIRYRPRAYERGDLHGNDLVIAATDDPEVNRQIATEARDCRALLNVVDEPELCTFIAPAILERGELQVAVATSGAAPALAARLRDGLCEVIGPEYAAVVRVLKGVRRRLREDGLSATDRRRILRDLATSDLPERVRSADPGAVDRLLGEIVGPGTTLAVLDVALD